MSYTGWAQGRVSLFIVLDYSLFLWHFKGAMTEAPEREAAWRLCEINDKVGWSIDSLLVKFVYYKICGLAECISQKFSSGRRKRVWILPRLLNFI